MIKYSKEKAGRIRCKFQGIEKIEHNFSQAYQDMLVLTCLNGKTNGTYLEIGAYHSTSLSNTYLLESVFGWDGLSIDIEPSTSYSFNADRKNKLIIGDALILDYNEILKKSGLPKRIDYLQLDIEPQKNTLECLKKLPLDDYRFNVITYETDFYDHTFSKEKSLENREKSREILKSKGYFLLAGNVCNLSKNDPFEDWYIDPEVIPSNVITGFTPNEEFNDVSENILLNR